MSPAEQMSERMEEDSENNDLVLIEKYRNILSEPFPENCTFFSCA